VIANVGDSRVILATKDENEVLKAIQLAINSKAQLSHGKLVKPLTGSPFGCGSLKVDGIQMYLWGVAWLACMQNVGARLMLGECSTRCHLEMWSLGLS